MSLRNKESTAWPYNKLETKCRVQMQFPCRCCIVWSAKGSSQQVIEELKSVYMYECKGVECMITEKFIRVQK